MLGSAGVKGASGVSRRRQDASSADAPAFAMISRRLPSFVLFVAGVLILACAGGPHDGGNDSTLNGGVSGSAATANGAGVGAPFGWGGTPNADGSQGASSGAPGADASGNSGSGGVAPSSAGAPGNSGGVAGFAGDRNGESGAMAATAGEPNANSDAMAGAAGTHGGSMSAVAGSAGTHGGGSGAGAGSNGGASTIAGSAGTHGGGSGTPAGAANGGSGAGSAGSPGDAGSSGGSSSADAECERIANEYATALEKQVACNPDLPGQCADRVPAGAGCECRIFIEPKDPFAIENLFNINDDWFSAACTTRACPDTCPTASRGTCQADATSELGGRCAPAARTAKRISLL